MESMLSGQPLRILLAIAVFAIAVLATNPAVSDVAGSATRLGNQSAIQNPPAASAQLAGTIQPPTRGTGSQSSSQGQNSAQLEFLFETTIITIATTASMVFAFCIMYFFGKASGEFSKYFVVLVVILMAVILMVAGYSEQQVAPAFGILGTILGYIFGHASNQGEAIGGQASETTPLSPAHSNTATTDPQTAPAFPRRDKPTNIESSDDLMNLK